jgi:ferredoxin
MVSFALLEKFLPDPSPGVTLLANRCLRRRLNTNQCTRCLDVCPSSALSLHGREIAFDKAKCTGCMSCVTACPQDALLSEYDLENLLTTLTTIEQGRDLIFSCAHHRTNDPAEIVVPCVGIFAKQILATILVKGCGSARFNVAGCSECHNQNASLMFLADYKLVTEALSLVDASNLVLTHQSYPSQTTDESRRSYLLGIRENILSGTKKSFKPTQKNQSPPKHDNTKHEKTNPRREPFKTRLVKKLLNDVNEESRPKIQSLLGYSLSVTGECTCCPLCKGICPTGAIKLERSAQGKKLRFEMQDCSGCGLCVEFCKKGALSLGKNPL